MEALKSLEELTQMDEKHYLMGSVTGAFPDLKNMHKLLSDEQLNENVPNKVKNQFNIARNMALYTYFFYALASEVHLKTYRVIEQALKIKADTDEYLMLRKLLKRALNENWISDSGFRHIEDPSEDNPWCKSLAISMTGLRNSQSHGSTLLVGDCLHHIRVCADFINQLFPPQETT